MPIPCHRCLFMDNLTAQKCVPEECRLLDDYLFHETREGYDKKMRHPDEIVQYAVELARNMSTREVARKIRERFGVDVSHVTVSKWTSKT